MSTGPREAFQRKTGEVMTALQAHICAGLEALEREAGGDAVFLADTWERPSGGGGITRVIANGRLFEKGGVNISIVRGQFSEEFARQIPGSGLDFFAAGISLVLHPKNPHVPTVHANFRHLEHGDRRWFGGGADLTPYYFHAEDKQHFHGVWQAFCERHPHDADYPRFRDGCDRYFYLPHRGERRGVGGIFFDNLFVDESRPDHAEALLRLADDGGRSFLDAYAPIVRRRMHTPYTAEQRRWQELRRGRYVEFNLVYDRGTIFGLKTDGRTESILMSLPPHVQWAYMAEPEAGTPEAALLAELRA